MQPIRFDIVPSPFGPCIIALMDSEVCFMSFADRDGERSARRSILERWPEATLSRDTARVRPLVRKLFGTRTKDLTVALHLEGTPFQMKVWKALCTIPSGKTATYGTLAKRIGHPNAVRAVGTACGKNPIAFIIPCHRILASDGSLGGYRWGQERKADILAWESARNT